MSLYVVANTAAPDSTRNLQTWTLLQEAAQWSGVLEVRREERFERLGRFNEPATNQIFVGGINEPGGIMQHS